ncbi:MAG: hypothetical protein ACRDUX_09880, partial [Mycobacterium sp.]
TLDSRGTDIAMGERRVEAVVTGSGAPGHLRVRFGQEEREVPAERVPAALRTPNSEFVAVVEGGELLRVESAGRAWIDIQDRVRSVLNAEWDPIGVAHTAADEYDSDIGTIYSMVRRNASPDELAAQLLQIEIDSMGLSGLPEEQRLEAARRLLALELPSL